MLSTKRIVMKAVSYKALTTVFLVTMAYIRFGNIKTALAIGVGDAIVKMLLYSGHEWLWHRFGGATGAPHVMLEHVAKEAAENIPVVVGELEVGK